MYELPPSAKTQQSFIYWPERLMSVRMSDSSEPGCQMCYHPKVSSGLIIWEMPWHLGSHPADMRITQILQVLVLISLPNIIVSKLFPKALLAR